MAKGKGKNTRHGRSSNPQSGSSHGVEKRFIKENTQQASRIYLNMHSGPTVAPSYAFVPEYPNVPAFPSGITRNANNSWPATHGEEIVSMDQLPGYIFICNGRTKEDCFKYRVFGLPRAKMDVLEKIKSRMKLFLYDFELKLLHGIFVAASNGKLAIEPTAFGGKFSAQVRFDIFKDCLPLPESAFKHIIEDNYQGSHKFRQELSGKQVTDLISLFRPVALSLPTAQIPHALATKMQPMHLPPVGTQHPSEHFYPAEAHQTYRPKNPALRLLDPYGRHVDQPRDREVFSITNVPAQQYVAGPSQFSKPLHGDAPLPPPPSTRTAAYWAAVASEVLKQADSGNYQGGGSSGLGFPVTSGGAILTPHPGLGLLPITTCAGAVLPPHPGLGLPINYAGAALPPPRPVPGSIGVKLLHQQLDSSSNAEEDNHRNPGVAFANHIVQEPVLLPSQFQAPPMYGANSHLQPPSSSTAAGYWEAVASEDPNLMYSVPYQCQWQPVTNNAENNVSTGLAPAYSTVHVSAGEFVPHAGISSDYYTHNVNLATTNGLLVQAHDQVTYYASAPAYWTVVPSSHDPNQLYSGYYQVPPPGSNVIGGDPNQLCSGFYQVLLPPGSSSGLEGEHHLVAAESVAGAAATINY